MARHRRVTRARHRLSGSRRAARLRVLCARREKENGGEDESAGIVGRRRFFRGSTPPYGFGRAPPSALLLPAAASLEPRWSLAGGTLEPQVQALAGLIKSGRRRGPHAGLCFTLEVIRGWHTLRNAISGRGTLCLCAAAVEPPGCYLTDAFRKMVHESHLARCLSGVPAGCRNSADCANFLFLFAH